MADQDDTRADAVEPRAVDSRTGRMKEVRFNVEATDALEAFTLLQNELKKVRTGETSSCTPMPTFSAFAASLFKIRQRIVLPPFLIDILRWHVDAQLTTDAMRRSELLFPAEDGGFRSRAALRSRSCPSPTPST